MSDRRPARRANLKRLLNPRHIVVDALMAIVAFVEERRDEILALDVNPLIVTTTGEVIAVDVLLEVNEERSQ